MKIKELRLAKGWTQEDLARHSGLSTRTIQRAESGKNIGSESMKCLAAVFEISINAINQEQHMANSKQSDTAEPVKLGKIEKSAIKYGQMIFQQPNVNEPDPLTKLERNALEYGKSLLKKLKP